MNLLGAWRQIAPGIHLAVAEPDTVNIGLIVGSERSLVIDTGSDPAQGASIRAAVATVTDRPLFGAVVTHAHADHFFGLAAFDDLTTIGHESLVETAGPAGPDSRSEPSGSIVPTPPNRPIVVAAAFDLGDRRVEVAHVGRGHTAGDLLVVVPDANVVFTGDLIESAGPPQAGPDAWIQEWPATLDGLVGLMTDHTIAIPGHGDPVNRAFVFEQRGQLAALAFEATNPGAGGRPALPLA